MRLARPVDAASRPASHPGSGREAERPAPPGRFALAAAALVAATAASAQTTGTLVGVVTDAATGEPIAGAIVAATSPALQGEQTAVTDAAGAYGIALLPPGEYRVTAQHEGHQPAERTGIGLELDKTLRVNIALAPESVRLEEVVVPTGVPPVVDVGSAETGAVVSSDLLGSVPLPRDFESSAIVSPTAERDTYGIAFAGATSPENNYILDGLSVRDPAFGTLGTHLLTNFVEEVDAKSGSFLPEYGRSSAGIVNVVTKSGSNEIHGSLFGNVTPGQLSPSSQSIGRYGEAIAWRLVPSHGAYEADFGAEFGGPLARDRLWLYVGFAPVLRYSVQERFFRSLVDDGTGHAKVTPTGQLVQQELPGTSREWSSGSTTFQVVGKLTWLAAEDHALTLSVHATPGSEKDVIGVNGTPSSQWAFADTSATDVIGRYTGKLLDKHLLLEVLGGWHRQTYENQPRTLNVYGQAISQGDTATIRWRGDRGLGLFEDVAPECNVPLVRPDGATVDACTVRNYVTGGSFVVQSAVANRLSGRVAASYLFAAAGHHALKAGIDLDRDDYDDAVRFTGGGFFNAYGSPPDGLLQVVRAFGTVSGPPGAFGGDTVTFLDGVRSRSVSDNRGYYVQDSWSPLDWLTVNAGVRWETQSIENTGSSATRIGIYDNVAPRVQAIYDPSRQGRSAIKASWGRFYESIPLDVADRAFGTQTLVNALWQNCGIAPSKTVNGSPVAAGCAPVGPPVNGVFGIMNAAGQPALYSQIGGVSPVAPDLQGSYTDQFNVSAEYEVARDLSIGVEYQGRRLGRAIEDMSSNNGLTYFIANPGESRPWTYQPWAAAGIARPNPRVAPAIDPATGRTYEATFPKPERSYDGFTVRLRKIFSEHWIAQASYTYSYLRGNYEGLFRAEDNQLDPNITSEYDLPSLMPNRSGLLAGDRPHQLKLFGAYVFDLGARASLTLGSAVVAMSGTPVNALGSHPFYGPGQAFILPRGSAGRTSAVTQIDLRAAFDYRLTPAYALRFTVDVFNVFNAQAPAYLDENYTFDAVEPIIGGQCRSHDAAGQPDPIAAVQASCPQLAYLKTTDGRPVTVNANWGRPIQPPTPARATMASAFQAPRAFRFGLAISF